MENITIEQQIADLEQQIKDKRSSLEKLPSAVENLPSDKEILHEVVGEKIQGNIPQYSPHAPTSSTLNQATDDIPSYLYPDLKDKVQELVNIAFTKSINEAIKIASSNPALLDAFHDVLVDELYDMLIERRKIQKIE